MSAPAPVQFVTMTVEDLEALAEAAACRALAKAATSNAGGGDWLTTAEVAAMVKVHPRTVTNLVKRGELQASEVGNQLRFQRSVVLAYLAR